MLRMRSYLTRPHLNWGVRPHPTFIDQQLMKPGDHVRHQTRNDSFGVGTVISIDEEAGTALVRLG